MVRSRRSRRSPPLPHAAREVRARDSTSRSVSRKTVVICLDGDISEVREQYREGIGGVIEWCEEGGITVDISDIFAPGRKVVTTRAGGALDVEFIHKGRSLTFLLQGRNLYVRGWRGRGKVLELDFKNQEEKFTLDRNCIKLRTGVNYSTLIHGGVGSVPTGLFYLRKAFDKLWRHAGGEKVDISREVAIFAVHISEATRFPPILQFICNSFTDLGLSQLGKDPSNCNYVTNYKKASATIMENVDLMKAGQEPLPIRIKGLEKKTMDELVCDVGILFRDGYNEEGSNFEHEDPPMLPIYENTMSEIGAGVQRKKKRRYAQRTINKNKRPKGGGEPKGGPGSAGEGKGPNGGGLMQGGQGPRGGRGLKGGGFGGSAASFHSTGGPKDGKSAAYLQKFGVGRACLSFHPTGEGLKGLLGDQALTSSAVRLRTVDIRQFELPCSSYKYISDEDLSMNVLAHRKMWTFPTSPLPIRKTSPPLFSLLAPRSTVLKQTQLRALPLPLDGTPHHQCRPSLPGILRTRYISRALRFFH